jgi:hypothetical protein
MIELYKAQEKLRAIDSLSNLIQKLSEKDSKEVAYLIHRIVESDYLNSDLAREITSWSIQANKDLLVNI